MHAVIEDFTVSIDDSIILKSIGDTNDTVIRNMIVNFLIKKSVWKKKELKQAVEEELKRQNAEYPEKNIDKIINNITQAAGGAG